MRAGAFEGAANAAIYGNSISQGIIEGAFTGGVSKFASTAFPHVQRGDFHLGQAMSTGLAGGISGGLVSKVYGGSFNKGFMSGAVRAASAYVFNNMAMRSWMWATRNPYFGPLLVRISNSPLAKRAYNLGARAMKPVNDVLYSAADKLGKYVDSLGKGSVSNGSAVQAVDEIAIQFGGNANQVYHAFRHIDKLGLDRTLVQTTVQNHLRSVVSLVEPGKPLNQIIEIGGQKIQYTAYQLVNGTINVGRIHGVP